jgi:hypothetical protein
MLFILASYTVPVHAQTTSISGLTYPSTVRLGSQILVGFTVTYSTPNYGMYVLVIAVMNKDSTAYAYEESVNASPSTCTQGPPLEGTPPDYHLAAACVVYDVSGSGSENVEFRLNLNTGYTDLSAVTGFEDSSLKMISDSLSIQPFSINVGMITLSLSAHSGVMVFVDGVSQSITTVSMDVTLGNHQIAVPGVVYTLTDARLRFDHWSDG